MKVLMAAPFDLRGRYRGGMTYIAQTIRDEARARTDHALEFETFETCRIQRSEKTISKLHMENIVNYLHVFRDLAREAKRTEADVVYYHTSYRHILLKDTLSLARARRATGAKTVLHIHFADVDRILFGNRFMDSVVVGLLNRHVDAVVFLSRRTAEAFVEHGLDPGKAHTIYNFHTLEHGRDEIGAKIERARNKEGIDLLYLGSIDRRKGIVDVLSVLGDIRGKITFHVCGSFGDAETEARYHALAAALGDRVVFHGYVQGDEKTRLLMDSEVLILPSYAEGFPIVVLEAFGSGCAVISSDVGATPEIFDGRSGTLVKPGDREGIRRAIQAAVDDRPGVLAAMRHNHEYSREFGVHTFVDAIAGVCRTVMQHRD